VWYVDDDADGWGGQSEVEGCEDLSTSGYSSRDGDCDDSTAAVSPDAAERCNGVDDDCDALTDDDDPDVEDADLLYLDIDGDGYASDGATSVLGCESRAGYTPDRGDCDDGDAQSYPGAPEVCDQGVDNDCDGRADGQDDDVVDASTWYRDADGDGLGDPSNTRLACTDADGWVLNRDDCDDGDPSVGGC
jgi:hypothetical protein